MILTCTAVSVAAIALIVMMTVRPYVSIIRKEKHDKARFIEWVEELRANWPTDEETTAWVAFLKQHEHKVDYWSDVTMAEWYALRYEFLGEPEKAEYYRGIAAAAKAGKQ